MRIFKTEKSAYFEAMLTVPIEYRLADDWDLRDYDDLNVKAAKSLVETLCYAINVVELHGFKKVVIHV